MGILSITDTGTVEEFSIELSVGDQWAKDLTKEKASMFEIEGDEISIKPQSSIVLEVKEHIKVPFNMYGLVLQTGSVFLEQGILIGAGKIEPSFNGKLRMLIYNTSKTKRTLKKGQKIASAIFMRTDKTIDASIYKDKRALVKESRGSIAKILAFFSADKKFTVNLIAMIITSSLTAAIVTYYISSSDEKIVETEQPSGIELPLDDTDTSNSTRNS
jgi:deoxycytidine triphosphate deaminase